ncbi:MAG: helix-turn-helix domain-containing protein [Oscillospiraceae bacterium]|jgi:transcriptional regulator with XRE-family HTH domain|nr:helix-turn-helix domain-containing protein [Oscillospiraceae bacterium]
MKPRSSKPGDKNMIGANIVRIRKEKNLKQKDLLARLQTKGIEISATGLSQLEGQYRKATDYELLAVSESLHVDFSDLLRRDVVE